MGEEIVNRFQKFDPTADEEEGLFVEKKDFKISQEESERSLVGKIHRDKKVSYQGLKSTMTALWKTTQELKVRELGNQMYQFVFPSHGEKLQKVLEGRSWTFDGQYLVLRVWEEGEYAEKNKEAFRFVRG